MYKIYAKKEMCSLVERWRKAGETIGCVPTMGFLHEGHLSLMRTARNENSKVVVTIFVNPTQFGPDEDFEKYPRNFDKDIELLDKERVDCVFVPSTKEMYSVSSQTFVNVENLTKSLCGRSRKNHFMGVTTIVAKLFNATKPHKAYFGQKDYQQYIVISKMVSDLDFDVEVKMGKIIRNKDGLALSSRNNYLKKAEKESALSIYRSLLWARDKVSKSEFCAKIIKKGIVKILEDNGGRIDYVEIVDAQTLEKMDEICDTVCIGIAVFFGSTRLIDNFLVSVEK